MAVLEVVPPFLMENKMKIVAVIPARGGSKGVPGKNLALIGGTSLLARTVQSAMDANHIDQVFVSSDAPEIREEAERFGASVILRPPHLAGDTASSDTALLHALDEIEEQDLVPDILVCLQCTSPFTAASDIDGVIETMLNEEADTALAVGESHHFLWCGLSVGAEVEPLGHEKSYRPRRQERTPQYAETGAIYAMRAPGFRQHKSRFFGKTVAHITGSDNLLEIDTPFDLELCRHIELVRAKKDMMSLLPAPIGAVLFDFDGVMTDDTVFVDEHGTEMVRAQRGDGLGIEMLRRTGLPIAVISKEKNRVVQKRCEKLKIECIQGVDDKETATRLWSERNQVALKSIVFVGNDVNDIPAAELVGCSFAPSDAHPEFLSRAHGVLAARGGRGAVRQVCDLILRYVKEQGLPI